MTVCHSVCHTLDLSKWFNISNFLPLAALPF